MTETESAVEVVLSNLWYWRVMLNDDVVVRLFIFRGDALGGCQFGKISVRCFFYRLDRRRCLPVCASAETSPSI